MEREFVPKKTITIQLTVELMDKLIEILSKTGLTKTKLLEKLISEEYHDLFPDKCI